MTPNIDAQLAKNIRKLDARLERASEGHLVPPIASHSRFSHSVRSSFKAVVRDPVGTCGTGEHWAAHNESSNTFPCAKLGATFLSTELSSSCSHERHLLYDVVVCQRAGELSKQKL